jgi:hypothetical protein
VSHADLEDLQRQLASYVEAIEAGELEASDYLHGTFRGALAMVDALLSTRESAPHLA